MGVFIRAPAAGVLCNQGGLLEVSRDLETQLEDCRSYQASSGSSRCLFFLHSCGETLDDHSAKGRACLEFATIGLL